MILRAAVIATCLTLLPTALTAHAQSTAKQRAAIQQACKSGVLTPDECQAKLAALNGNASQPQSRSQQQPASGTAGGTVYHEPRGRFSITVPAGWQVDDSQGNLKLTNGDNWATFDTTSMPGGALAVAQHTADQMKQYVSDWTVAGQGPYTAGGHPAAGVTATCTVPTRAGPTKRVFVFTAMAAGNDNYVVMTASTDRATGKAANAAMSQAFETIHFGNE